MKNIIVSLLLALLCLPIPAQTIFWADTVISYSSEISSVRNNADQVLGRPNVPRNIQEHPHAWLSSEDSLSEITVGFSFPLNNIHQLIIAESFYHNAIQKVYIITTHHEEIEVYSQLPGKLEYGSLINNFFFKTPEHPIEGVRLILNALSSTRMTGIDAIGLSSSTKAISILPQVSEQLVSDVKVEKLPSPINSSDNEHKPVLDISGERLLFSRSLENTPHLFDASQKDNEWKVTEVMLDSNSNIQDKYITAISPDGLTALSVIDASGTEFQLSTFELSDSIGMDQEQIIIPNVELLKQKSDFFLSNSRKVMLMSLTDHRDEKRTDIYVSFKNDNGNWSTPLNLGNTINTVSKEITPFLSADETTLFFASDGHQGFGGTDLFVSKRLNDSWTEWSAPENLGTTINTTHDEKDLFLPISGDMGYFVRSDHQNQTDIYSVKLPILLPPEPVAIVSGKVFDKKSNQPIRSRIIYTDIENQKEVGTVYSSSKDGKYYITLPLGKKYAFLAQANGYLSQSEHIDLTLEEKEVNAEQQLYLIPIEKEAHLTLNNIFFDHNSSYLSKESFDELNRIIKLLKEEPSIKKVEICGYTDNQGDDKYNKWLSEKRANSVRNYLIKKGIDSNRLIALGKGEENAVADNNSVEGRKKNRRVDFSILEMDKIN
ncbi:OmpA family protein [Flammeovirga sp. MY04]|uniref:OmpA family protein n=1 Tax=Flammeovirga sp. MY04 TaxID=1191459 RepID=UPI0013051BFC|nr:OmpA family protein [Flammeovirga sp. MY04]ANQ48679.2 OmpA family protein [Flammeovirga sp. MY04]